MNLITVTLASAALLSTSSALVSAISKSIQSIRAERALKNSVKAKAESVQSLLDRFGHNGRDVKKSVISSEQEADQVRRSKELLGEVEDLIVNLDLNEGAKKELLSALHQPSEVGQRQYAGKLFAQMSEAATRQS